MNTEDPIKGEVYVNLKDGELMRCMSVVDDIGGYFKRESDKKIIGLVNRQFQPSKNKTYIHPVTGERYYVGEL